jgi:hypothetical protein
MIAHPRGLERQKYGELTPFFSQTVDLNTPVLSRLFLVLFFVLIHVLAMRFVDFGVGVFGYGLGFARSGHHQNESERKQSHREANREWPFGVFHHVL